MSIKNDIIKPGTTWEGEVISHTYLDAATTAQGSLADNSVQQNGDATLNTLNVVNGGELDYMNLSYSSGDGNAFTGTSIDGYTLNQDTTTAGSPTFVDLTSTTQKIAVTGGFDKNTLSSEITTTDATITNLATISVPYNSSAILNLEVLVQKNSGTGVGSVGGTASIIAQVTIINNFGYITSNIADNITYNDSQSLVDSITIERNNDNNINIIGTGTVDNTLVWRTRAENFDTLSSYPIPVPYTIGGMEFWVQAADLNHDGGFTNPSNGTAIASWSDLQSRFLRNVTQSDGSQKPLFDTDNALNGLPGVTFDGSNDVLSAERLFTGVADYTIFTVATTTGNGAIYSNGDPTLHSSATYQIASGVRQILHGGVGTVQGGAVSGDPEIVVIQYHYPNVYMRVNGVDITLSSPTLGFDGALIDTLNVGAYSPSGGNSFDGTIYTCIHYDSKLNLTNVQAVETYLADLYGITI